MLDRGSRVRHSIERHEVNKDMKFGFDRCTEETAACVESWRLQRLDSMQYTCSCIQKRGKRYNQRAYEPCQEKQRESKDIEQTYLTDVHRKRNQRAKRTT